MPAAVCIPSIRFSFTKLRSGTGAYRELAGNPAFRQKNTESWMPVGKHQVPVVSTSGQKKTVKNRDKLPVGLSKECLTATVSSDALGSLLVDRGGLRQKVQVSGIREHRLYPQ